MIWKRINRTKQRRVIRRKEEEAEARRLRRTSPDFVLTDELALAIMRNMDKELFSFYYTDGKKSKEIMTLK